MKITFDRKLIDGLERLSDEQLRHLLCTLLSGSGNIKNKSDLSQIRAVRAVLCELTDTDLCRMNELAEIFYCTRQRKDGHRS